MYLFLFSGSQEGRYQPGMVGVYGPAEPLRRTARDLNHLRMEEQKRGERAEWWSSSAAIA
jgi:hypothetical protein